MNEAEASGYLLMAGGLVWVMVGIIGWRNYLNRR
jgi:hypothetical protein